MQAIPYTQIKSYLLQKEKSKAEQYEKLRITELENSIEILRLFFKNKHCKVFLFGSVNQKGKFSPDSDIDIAVGGFHGSRIDLFCELSDLFRRKIDVVILEKSSISEYILENACQIY
jgi:predicted nucleotidyltransferase